MEFLFRPEDCSVGEISVGCLCHVFGGHIFVTQKEDQLFHALIRQTVNNLFSVPPGFHETGESKHSQLVGKTWQLCRFQHGLDLLNTKLAMGQNAQSPEPGFV